MRNKTLSTKLNNTTAEQAMMQAALLAVDAILLEAQVRRKADKKRAHVQARDYARLAHEFEQKMEQESVRQPIHKAAQQYMERHAVRNVDDLWDVARGAGLVE